ncbi:MAG TPA: hypothetical protein VN915_05120 [Elusimicrobiota bacterium]|nr:hypothetical protein [Elusimicrobiota bacterium]
MLLLLLALTLNSGAPALAGEAVLPPLPPAAAVQPASPALVELTPELLNRWGYDVQKTLALPPSGRAELQAQLTRLEAGRVRRLELLRRAKPAAWRDYVDERELLTDEGNRIVDAYLARLADKPMLVPAEIKAFERADGKPLTAEDMLRARQILDRMFEGVSEKGGKDLSGDVVVDAHVRNETVYDMTITSPKTGFALQVGQLYADDQHPLAETSPYANLTWGKDSKPDSGVDYRIKASLGYVDLRSRYFSDDTPDAGAASALSLGQQLGVPRSALDQISKYTAYDDPYQSHGIIVSSLLAQLGRAYHLAGPVDLSWTTGALIKTMWVAPNAAFDETLGLRVKLKNGMSIGFFGGVAQNVSPVGDELLQEAMTNQTIKPGLYLENDPHVSAALWGKVPGASDLSFSVSASQRWTATTHVSQGDASLMTTFLNHPIAFKGEWSRESGPGIGFDREKGRAEVDYGIAPDAQAFLAYQRDRIRYGNAQVDANSVLAGFKIEFGPKATLTVDQLMGGQYKDTSPLHEHFTEQLAQIQRDLNAGVDAMDKLDQAYRGLRPGLSPAQLDGELNKLSLALSRLNPSQAEALLGQLRLTPAQQADLGNLWLKTVSPSSPYYAQITSLVAPGSQAQKTLGKVDDWSRYFEQHQGQIRQLIGLLTDEKVWDGAVIAAARAQLLMAMKGIGSVNVPVLGGDFALKIDAPAVLAASNILQSRLSPLAPVQPGQIDAFLLKEAGVELGLPGNPTTQQVAGALFGLADKQLKQQLAQGLAPLQGELGSLGTPQALAGRILSSVPPNVANLLKQNYGPNLTGLIPPDLSGASLKSFLDRLPDQITSFLEKRYGNQLATGIGQAVSWAGDLLSREINMTMIQLLLASEELNRLTADHGQKIDELDLRMAMRSFDELDARGQEKVEDRLSRVKRIVAEQTGAEDARLAEKFELHGKTVLQTLQLSPSWPRGLRVEVDEDAWMPLMTLYGDGRVFDLIQKIKARYLASPRPDGLIVELGWRANDPLGTWISSSKDPARLKIELGRPKDERDAEFRLSNLAGYVDEKR